MIEGVAALPWIQEARIENGRDFLRCEACLKENGDDIGLRRAMHCGLMPSDQWLGDSPAFLIADGTPLETCAGYTTSLPEVSDISRQFFHWENAALSNSVPGGACPALLEGLVLFKSAGEARASYRIKEQADKAKAGNRG